MKLVKSSIGKTIYRTEKDKICGPAQSTIWTKKEEKTGLNNWFQREYKGRDRHEELQYSFKYKKITLCTISHFLK